MPGKPGNLPVQARPGQAYTAGPGLYGLLRPLLSKNNLRPTLASRIQDHAFQWPHSQLVDCTTTDHDDIPRNASGSKLSTWVTPLSHRLSHTSRCRLRALAGLTYGTDPVCLQGVEDRVRN